MALFDIKVINIRGEGMITPMKRQVEGTFSNRSDLPGLTLDDVRAVHEKLNGNIRVKPFSFRVVSVDLESRGQIIRLELEAPHRDTGEPTVLAVSKGFLTPPRDYHELAERIAGVVTQFLAHEVLENLTCGVAGLEKRFLDPHEHDVHVNIDPQKSGSWFP